MKTRKGRVSLAVAAEHIDLSARAFNFLIEAGVIERQAPNVGYDLDVVRIKYIRHQRARASGQGDGTASLAKERAELAKEQRETAALKNAQTRGDLVSIESVVFQVGCEYGVVRERFLSIPGKVADECSGKTREEIEEIIRAEISEALEELHDPPTITGGHGVRAGAARSVQGS
jgi:phage terminase Nu1 subunit (DNA packaging protein)